MNNLCHVNIKLVVEKTNTLFTLILYKNLLVWKSRIPMELYIIFKGKWPILCLFLKFGQAIVVRVLMLNF